MSNSLGFVVSLAEMEQFYRGGKAGQIIELMNKTNDIMDDVLWMESNQSDGHLTRIRTGLPEVYWRRLYQGTPPSKSQWSQVKEGCGILEAIMELDVEELRCAIGPSICQDCYEVSGDVAVEFERAFAGHENEILIAKENGKYQLDLWKANEIVLLDAGVLPEHIEITDICTCCNPDLLFSHRASHGKRGNLGAFLCLK